MKFKNIMTGVILEPKSRMVEEQLNKSNMYEILKEATKKESKEVKKKDEQ